MKQRAIQSLLDIHLLSSELMEHYVVPVTLDEYSANKLLKRGTERLVEVIGEATNRALKDEPRLIDDLPEARNVIGIRNRIAHGYDVLSDEYLWLAATIGVPELDRKIVILLQGLGLDPDYPDSY